MDSEAHERELQMPLIDGFGAGFHESSMMKLLTSGMDDFPPVDGNVRDVRNHRECLRNHRASAGGDAIDGCGEFMQGEIGDTPDALKCAACGCHRNFHRREADVGALEEDLQKPVVGGSAGLNDSSKLSTSGNRPGMNEIRPFEATVRKITKYLECLRNHYVSAGGHAVDGCQEFIAGGEEGTLRALNCAACECHRNFHRREVEGERSCDCRQILDKETTWTSGGVPGTLSTGPTESDDQDGGSSASAAARKKRFRTKFSSEQLEKMRSFADKLGWKIQKHDEGPVHTFCDGIGMDRKLFKVWMHNNKHKRSRE